MSEELGGSLLQRVIAGLGLDRAPAASLDGLNRLYRAWCRSVPFDNVRKRIALDRKDSAPLPGGEAEDFFEHWLEQGTGGTCWPTSNALYTLLRACGFAARRVSASMRDLGKPNHGSVIVSLDGGDYLADASMLTDVVFPLRRGERFEISDALHPVIVEPVEETWRVWHAFTMNRDLLPCRLLRDPVDHAFFLERYEASRAASPFNDFTFARRNFEGAVVSVVDRTRVVKDAAGVCSRELPADEIDRALVSEIGISASMLAQLSELGA